MSLSYLLIPVLLIIGCADRVGIDPASQDLAKLFVQIKHITEDSWDIRVEKKYGYKVYLNYKQPFKAFAHYTNGPPQFIPSETKYEFGFIILPKVNPQEYAKKKTELEEYFRRAEKESLDNIQHETGKGDHIFSPKNKKEREIFSRYLSIKKELESLPTFYFKNIGIQVIENPYYQVVAESDKKVLDKAEKQQIMILKLLTKY